MSHVLRRPWLDENPKDLNKQVLVERLALDERGRVVFLGREVLSDGTKGKVHAWPATAHSIASMLYALAVGYRGMFWARSPRSEPELWAELASRIAEERERMAR